MLATFNLLFANAFNLVKPLILLLGKESTPSQTTHLKHFQSADDTVKLNENGRKFSKRVGNNVQKEEIAHYELFKRLVLQIHKNQGSFGKGLISRCAI